MKEKDIDRRQAEALTADDMQLEDDETEGRDDFIQLGVNRILGDLVDLAGFEWGKLILLQKQISHKPKEAMGGVDTNRNVEFLLQSGEIEKEIAGLLMNLFGQGDQLKVFKLENILEQVKILGVEKRNDLERLKNLIQEMLIKIPDTRQSSWGDFEWQKVLDRKQYYVQLLGLVVENTGGIDLTSDNALQIKKENRSPIQALGDDIIFNIDPAMLQQLQNAQGFEPSIIKMEPMTDLKFFLSGN